MQHYLHNDSITLKLVLGDPCLFGQPEYDARLPRLEFASNRVWIERITVEISADDFYREEDDDGTDWNRYDETREIEALFFADAGYRQMSAQWVVDNGTLHPLTIGVDSGQVGAIVEGLPWVDGDWEGDSENPPYALDNDYAMGCFLTIHAEAGTWRNHQAFASRVSHGDGECAIWVYQHDGKVVAAVVELC